jgi:RNA polymerase sigma factor (sigma-70 family)
MTTEQQPSDAELISAVRDGDTTAYGELFSRHVEAARRLARQLTPAGDVEDLVSEAFAKVLTIVQRGGGPDLAFRAYLLTAVRSLHIDSIRGAARLKPVDDFTPFDDGVPFRDTAVEGFDNHAAARAFATLPERWQLVLWHTEVEGQKAADVAKLLGMSANSVSALAYRAREGLRQAFLNMHAQDTEDDACAWTQDNLGAYIRNAASKRDSAKVRAHVDECRRCMGIYLELSEVNTNLSGILGPLVLGSAAAGYIAAAVGGAAPGGVLGFLSAHATGAALVGVAAAVVLITGLVLGLRSQPEPTLATADRPVTPSAPLTFSNGGPTLSPAGRTDAPPAGSPGSTEPDDPVTTSASPSGASVSSSTPGDAGTPDAPNEPNAPEEEPDGSIITPPVPTPVDPPAQPVDTTIVVAKEHTRADTVMDVTLAVSGLPEDGGTLEIVTSGTETVRLDGECEGEGPARTCAVPGDTKQLRFSIVTEEIEQTTTVSFIIHPLGVADSDNDNNDATVVLEPAP